MLWCRTDSQHRDTYSYICCCTCTIHSFAWYLCSRCIIDTIGSLSRPRSFALTYFAVLLYSWSLVLWLLLLQV